MGDDEDEDEFDWQVEQEVYKESSEEQLRAMQTYGFGSQRSGVFARLQVRLKMMMAAAHYVHVLRQSSRTQPFQSPPNLIRQEELSDVIDVKNPEGTTAGERRQARLDAEGSAFSPDHYL